MPFTTPSNQFIWGLAKQTNEATVKHLPDSVDR